MERDPLIQPSPSFQQLRLAGEHHEQPHKQLIRPPIARPVLAGDDLLAEASPTDTIWGIGLPDSDQRVSDPSKWRGANILGCALMQARERLRFLEEHQPRAASLPSTDTLAETVNNNPTSASSTSDKRPRTSPPRTYNQFIANYARDHQGDWPWKDEQGNDRDPAMDDDAASYAADYSDAPRVY